jgi:hypothetical protein
MMKRDDGSTIPLIIGLATVLLSVIFTASELQSLFVAKQRALSDARFAALYVAKAASGNDPVIGLDYSQTVRALLLSPGEVEVRTLDGKTFEAIVCVLWVSPLGVHQPVQICDRARSRVIA